MVIRVVKKGQFWAVIRITVGPNHPQMGHEMSRFLVNF